ncbi:MAG: hypothetical protein M3525_13135 [Acidobacteriota bacterium]|nr:hypothetical protein [Acidobacteriota bacterium]
MNENTVSETNNDTGNVKLLQKLKQEVFASSDEKLAVALGRPVEEITAWLGGEEIDEDAQEKIHALAQMRLGSENQAAE